MMPGSAALPASHASHRLLRCTREVQSWRAVRTYCTKVLQRIAGITTALTIQLAAIDYEGAAL